MNNTKQNRSVIVCLGDSLTAGFGVPFAAAYPTLLQNRLQKLGYPHKVVNAGISGDTTADALRRLDEIWQHKPSVAIVALGANDGLCGLDLKEMKYNLAEILDQLQRANVCPILAGIGIPPHYGHNYTQQFAAIYVELAREKAVARVPSFLKHVAGYPELNQEDGIHPNAEGYKKVLTNVWPILQPLLSQTHP